jgi:hypothetical protein
MTMAPLIAHGQPFGMYPAPMMAPHCCPCIPAPVQVTTVVLEPQHTSCRHGRRWINWSLRRKILRLMGLTGACAVVGGAICLSAGLGLVPVLVSVGFLTIPIIVGLVEVEKSETRQ